LNETDANGQGISVNALYRVQLFDASQSGRSMQRRAQLLIDEPIQNFFASSVTLKSPLNVENLVQEYLDAFAEVGELKVHLFAEGANKILIRLANIADLFDGTPTETPQFDLLGYARALYQMANPEATSFKVDVTERSLGNNMDYAQM